MAVASPYKTVLLLGGTGKISTRLAPLLSSNGYHVILASRSGTSLPSLPNCHGLRFDWFDKTTYCNPFKKFTSISAIFLVAPLVMDFFSLMKSFIDFAIENGVNRFVLLSGSVLDVGDGPMLNRVAQYLISLNIQYAILRPSWFMENFSEMLHVRTICDEDKIFTATGQGRVPFISAVDIAGVAYKSLTDELPPNTEYHLLGPELLSYDMVANILTESLGRKISHVKISEEEAAASMSDGGLPEEYAKELAKLDTAIKMGEEERLNDVVLMVTGRTPRKFEDYVRECIKKGVWQKKQIR